MTESFVNDDVWNDWGRLDVWHSHTRGWCAKAFVEATNPNDTSRQGWLHYEIERCDTPEEAVARVEKALIETLAQGGQLEERRRDNGRRSYDLAKSSIIYDTPDGRASGWLTRRRQS